MLKECASNKVCSGGESETRPFSKEKTSIILNNKRVSRISFK